MTPGGAVLVGTTVALAALDGGLSYLIGSAIVGGTTYVLARRSMTQLPQKVAESQLEDLRKELETSTDPELRQRLRKQLEGAEKDIRARLAIDRGQVNAASKRIGVGAAICPGAGLAILALRTRHKWQPVAIRAMDAWRSSANGRNRWNSLST